MFEKTLVHSRAWLLTAAAAAALLQSAAVTAQEASTSELLEEAVYQEETVGDLDAAIDLYQRIADDAAARRPLAARALYRLYRCHERQGNEVQAAVVFARLRKEYPDYEELLGGEDDDLPRSLVLQDVPWLDDEIQVLVARLATGMEIGTLITSVHPAVVDDEEIWRVGLRRFLGLENQGNSVVEVRRADFTPIKSRIRHSQLGRLDVDYLPGEVVFHTLGEDGGRRDRTVKEDRQLYDNEMGIHLMRRLPLEVGYKGVLPIVTLFGQVTDLTVEVTSREMIEVPAGTFECFRLDLPLLGQTFFLSTGPRREPVKIEAPGVTFELVATIHRRAEEPFTYRHPELDFSVSSPAGWQLYRHGCFDPRQPDGVQLFDPEGRLRACVDAFPLSEDGEHTPRALADWTIDYLGKYLAGLEVREESWDSRPVDGRPATTWITDYVAGDVPMVRRETVVVGEGRGLKITFTTTRATLEELGATFDEIAFGVRF